jgi:hypothetical protein
MPLRSDTGGSASASLDGPDPQPMSRRSVLRGAAGAGAAGLAMAALPAAALAGTAQPATRKDDLAQAGAQNDGIEDGAQESEAVVVHVRDVRRGEMDVYRGTSHARVTDRALAARLARASR